MSARYQTEGLIARGGMAEVLLARMDGAAGFSKRVALKRILRAYADSAQLTAMFLDEARLAAQLSHPNVVQVFDFGEDPEGYFIAMEYVAGPDLAGVLRALRHLGERPPEAPMLDVVLQTLRGLEHAHRLAGPDGASLGVIHRDVSPGNVLLTREGVVKLSDFGVARTTQRLSETTQAGKTRGKAAYMSPEQARSRPIDARSDLFSVGLLLWEALAGERCYVAADEPSLIRMAALGETRSLASVGVDVAPPLAQVLAQALQVDPARRFPSAAAMAEALETYHRATYPAYTTSTGIGALVERALAVLPPLPHLALAGSATSPLPDAEEWQPPAPGASEAPPRAPSAPVRRPRKVVAAEEPVPSTAAAATSASVPAAPPPPPAAKGSAIKLALVAVGAAGAVIIGLAVWDHRPDPQRTAAPVAPMVAKPVGPPPAQPVLPPRAERSHEAAVEVRTPAVEVPGAPSARRGASGYLSIKCDPWCEIYVDGRDTHRRSPAEDIALSPGTHSLRLVNPPTTLERRGQVVIQSGQKVARYFNLVLK